MSMKFSFFLLFFLQWQAFIFAQSADKSKITPADCAIGQWGNDFSICGADIAKKSGKGLLQKRKDEELILVLDKKGTGYFSFYDCQAKKKFTTDILFSYTVVNNQIRFRWLGEPEEIKSISASFDYINTYRFRCSNDTLFFVDGLLKNSLYMNTNYFIRRK